MIKDLVKETEKIVRFIKETLENSNRSHLILGVSGGIDSAVTLALALRAVEHKDFLVLYTLPYFENTDLSDVNLIVKSLKVSYWIYPIKEQVDSFGITTSYRKGNVMARVRMINLYDKAYLYNGLVLNTCNLSEDLIGYATKFGDAAGDLAPIAHLTKTEIYQLAEYLDIPQKIITKKPSAELWEGQTDEGEIGLSYEYIDKFIDEFRLENLEEYLFSDWMLNKYPNEKRLIKLSSAAVHKLLPMPKIPISEPQLFQVSISQKLKPKKIDIELEV